MTREKYHWSEFYQDLAILGPEMLTGLHDEIREYVIDTSRMTDEFWSESLEETLRADWDNPSKAVRATVEQWHLNVLECMTHVLGPMSVLPELVIQDGMTPRKLNAVRRSVQKIGLVPRDEILIQLTASALYGLRANSSPAEVSLQGVITPLRRVHEGALVRALTIPWKLIVHKLGKDWNEAFKIPPHKWEELIAAAFDEAGFHEVILTPRSGDFGRDVIATTRGVGSIRIINSVKAYKPGHLVNQDEVRALMGVMQADHQASKGMVMTTSGFAPRIRADPYISPLMPYRLELMDGDQLRKWLVEVAGCRKKASS